MAFNIVKLVDPPVKVTINGPITWKGPYDNGANYSIGDGVLYLGSSYIAIAPTMGNLPTNTNYWDVLAQAVHWFSGSGAPSDNLGVDGDFYIDTDTFNIYQKVGGTWA